MSQTQSYSFTNDKGNVGQRYDSGFYRVESFAAEDTVEFGRAVAAGTDAEKQVAAVAAANDTIRGVALFQHPDVSGEYEAGEMVPVLRQGLVWVLAAATVAVDEDVYVDLAGATGNFTNTDATSSNPQVPTAKFRTAGGSGDLVLVEVNLV